MDHDFAPWAIDGEELERGRRDGAKTLAELNRLEARRNAGMSMRLGRSILVWFGEIGDAIADIYSQRRRG